jgi:vacuolar protein sorting-associated protein VTA1
MPLSIPPELKKITPYVRRAEELDRDKGNPESRLVSYYCRQYAVHTGIALATTPAGKGCLGELLGNLEEEKQAMDSFTRDESKFLCQKFAEKIFDKADQEDRSGKANRNTARTFYAAASFLEILQQFYQDDDDSEEVAEQKKKAVYCKWKSTEILKAIKEGRDPTPGGYGEEAMDVDADDGDEEVKEETAPEETEPSPPPAVETVEDDSVGGEEEEESPESKMPVNENDSDGSGDEGTEVQLGPPPAYPPILPPAPPMAPPAPPMAPPAPPMDIPKPPLTFNLPPAAPSVIPPPVARKPAPPKEKPKKTTFFGMGSSSKKSAKKASKLAIADATELTRFALAALEDKDATLAAERLEQALKVLGR